MHFVYNKISLGLIANDTKEPRIYHYILHSNCCYVGKTMKIIYSV